MLADDKCEHNNAIYFDEARRVSIFLHFKQMSQMYIWQGFESSPFSDNDNLKLKLLTKTSFFVWIIQRPNYWDRTANHHYSSCQILFVSSSI